MRKRKGLISSVSPHLLRLSPGGVAIGLIRVPCYILWNPFAQGKIAFNEKTSMVVYKSKMTHSKGEGGEKNFAVYPACDFIAAIQHIPDKNAQRVRYYGWYSNKMGRETKTGRIGDGKVGFNPRSTGVVR